MSESDGGVGVGVDPPAASADEGTTTGRDRRPPTACITPATSPPTAMAGASEEGCDKEEDGGYELSSRKGSMRAPETPMWRFVNKAKKREGYSSSAAGKVVEGLSGHELAGKFNPPVYDGPGRGTKADGDDGGYREWKEDQARVKEARKVGRLIIPNEDDGEDDDEGMASLMVLSTSPESLRLYAHDDEEEDGSATTTEELAPGRKRSPMSNRDASEGMNNIVDEVEERERKMIPEREIMFDTIMMQRHRMAADQSSTNAMSDKNEQSLESAMENQQQGNTDDGLMPPPIENVRESTASTTEGAVGPIPPPRSSSHYEDKKSKRPKAKQWASLLLLLLVVASAIVLGVFLDGEKKSGEIVEDAIDVALGSSRSPTRSVMPSQYPSTTTSTSPYLKPTQYPMVSSSSPTPNPSVSPTSRPSSAQLTTLRPTEKPVCDATYEDFNLCLAIDMSGSVCNKGTGFECVSCDPELICYDSSVDKGTCCNNFLYLIEFAKSIIGAFGAIAAQRSFSVVAFATDAELVSELTTASDAMDTLDALTFTGGRTNHAAAINTCRTSLESSSLSDRKNFLLLITDGNPSEPSSLPEAEAEAAAEIAKSGGILMVPVMIKQAVSSYLQGISSDGTVLDASDFDDLVSLQATLMAQVECQ